MNDGSQYDASIDWNEFNQKSYRNKIGKSTGGNLKQTERVYSDGFFSHPFRIYTTIQQYGQHITSIPKIVADVGVIERRARPIHIC